MSLTIIPLELSEANYLVKMWHRHHKECQGHRFSIGVYDNKVNKIVGAAIVGRPVARLINYKNVLEVTRLVTDGTKNACSILYAAAARVGKEMGYHKIQTYILDSETGISLTASSWILEDDNVGGGAWNISRPDRRSDQPICKKQRWSKILNPLNELDGSLIGLEEQEIQQIGFDLV